MFGASRSESSRRSHAHALLRTKPGPRSRSSTKGLAPGSTLTCLRRDRREGGPLSDRTPFPGTSGSPHRTPVPTRGGGPEPAAALSLCKTMWHQGETSNKPAGQREGRSPSEHPPSALEGMCVANFSGLQTVQFKLFSFLPFLSPNLPSGLGTQDFFVGPMLWGPHLAPISSIWY